MQPRLTRSTSDRMVAGVCGGLAQYFAIDPVIVRLIFVLISLTSGIGFLLYPLLWIVMPKGGPGPLTFPHDTEEWRRRVEAVGQEAAEFGQSVEREVREALGGQSGQHRRAPPTYAPRPGESYNYDPYTGQPISQQQDTSLAQPRRKGSRWAGIALVGLGLVFTAQYLGLPIDVLMPVLMIAAGIYMLARR